MTIFQKVQHMQKEFEKIHNNISSHLQKHIDEKIELEVTDEGIFIFLPADRLISSINIAKVDNYIGKQCLVSGVSRKYLNDTVALIYYWEE